MWPLITTLAGYLFKSDGIIGKYLDTKAQTAQAKATADLELQRAQIEYAKQEGINVVESERNKLNATGQWFKFVSYVLLNYPIVVTIYSPAKGKEIFENIGIIPQWYAMLYVAVVGVIWGLPVAANWMSSVFQAIQQAWASRQDKKIEKIQALGEATALNLDQAKKEIFDTLKKAANLPGYTQAQVDIINPVLDKVLQAIPTTTVVKDDK